MKQQDSSSRPSSQTHRWGFRQREARERHEFLAGLSDPALVEYFELARESSALADKVYMLREEQIGIWDATSAGGSDPALDPDLLADDAPLPGADDDDDDDDDAPLPGDDADLALALANDAKFPIAPCWREDRAEKLNSVEDLYRVHEEIESAIEASRDFRAEAAEKFAEREASVAACEAAEEAEAAEFGLGDGRDEAIRRAETAYARQARAQLEEKTQPLLARLRKAVAQAEGEARTRAEALALRLAHRAPVPKQRREAIVLLVRLRQPSRRTAARTQLATVRAAEARLRKAAAHQKAAAAHQKALVLARTNWREIDRELCHELREMDPADREKAAPRLQAHLAKRYGQVKAEKAVAWAKVEKAVA